VFCRREHRFYLWTEIIIGDLYFIEELIQEIQTMTHDIVIMIRSSPERIIEKEYDKKCRYSSLSILQDIDMPSFVWRFFYFSVDLPLDTIHLKSDEISILVHYFV